MEVSNLLKPKDMVDGLCWSGSRWYGRLSVFCWEEKKLCLTLSDDFRRMAGLSMSLHDMSLTNLSEPMPRDLCLTSPPDPDERFIGKALSTAGRLGRIRTSYKWGTFAAFLCHSLNKGCIYLIIALVQGYATKDSDASGEEVRSNEEQSEPWASADDVHGGVLRLFGLFCNFSFCLLKVTFHL